MVDYYLPDGRWTHLLTGEIRDGDRWHRTQYDFFGLPLFVRPGTVLPIGAVDNRPDYDYADGVTFRVYELADGSEQTSVVSTHQASEALRLTVQRMGRRVTVRASGDVSARWQIQFAGIESVKARTEARTAPDPLGIVVQPAVCHLPLECELPA